MLKTQNKPDSGAEKAVAVTQALPINDAFCVIEVDEAEILVGSLFRRRFETEYFPETPRHFVAFALMLDGSIRPIGYVHYTMWENCALCGGLVVDERAYRLLPQPVRNSIRGGGGIAELLLEKTFQRMPTDTVAIWGHVGSKMSEKVCIRVGFERTDDPYVMVAWRQEQIDDNEKRGWIQRAISLGPF